TGAILAVVAAVLGSATVLVLMPLSVLRLCRFAAGHRTASTRVVGVLGMAWVVLAAGGVQLSPASRGASMSTVALADDQVSHLRADIRDRQVFADAIEVDRFDEVPGTQLLTELRGRDVLLVFVESYGRVAVEDPTISPQVNEVLAAGSKRLRGAGYHSRSAFLTSPTFGAASWLAHATLQSGLWVDGQQRYNQLLTNDRLTLTRAFERAGWRTAFVLPANTQDWPVGSSFYGFDTLYDARDLDYHGREFGWSTMPDQYTLQ